MNNKDLLLERILLNMKYDSKKTLYENRIILNEDGSNPLTFIGVNPNNPAQKVKWTTIGNILSKVSNNLPSLKEIKYDQNTIVPNSLMTIVGKKYLRYDPGKTLDNYWPTLVNCITETYSNGRPKSWDQACRKKHSDNVQALEKQRHTFCLSRILNNQGLLDMPFAIQVSGTKKDQFGESNDGTYKILFFLTGEDCKFGGFNYYHDSGYETSLNWDYPLTPLKAEFISKPKEQPKPVVKKVEQKVETPKLTPEQQKKWCADRGKVWSDEVNACIGKEITLDSSKMEIQKKEKEKESTGGIGAPGTKGKGVEINAPSSGGKGGAGYRLFLTGGGV